MSAGKNSRIIGFPKFLGERCAAGRPGPTGRKAFHVRKASSVVIGFSYGKEPLAKRLHPVCAIWIWSVGAQAPGKTAQAAVFPISGFFGICVRKRRLWMAASKRTTTRKGRRRDGLAGFTSAERPERRAQAGAGHARKPGHVFERRCRFPVDGGLSSWKTGFPVS